MRECKKCFEVKPLRRMWATYGFLTGTRKPKWICKKCANEIAFDAILKESDEIEKNL